MDVDEFNLRRNFIQEKIVVDNGSTDLTSEVAKCAGATVLVEPNKGYGSACLKGIEYIQNSNQKIFLHLASLFNIISSLAMM